MSGFQLSDAILLYMFILSDDILVSGLQLSDDILIVCVPLSNDILMFVFQLSDEIIMSVFKLFDDILIFISEIANPFRLLLIIVLKLQIENWFAYALSRKWYLKMLAIFIWQIFHLKWRYKGFTDLSCICWPFTLFGMLI